MYCVLTFIQLKIFSSFPVTSSFKGVLTSKYLRIFLDTFLVLSSNSIPFLLKDILCMSSLLSNSRDFFKTQYILLVNLSFAFKKNVYLSIVKSVL